MKKNILLFAMLFSIISSWAYPGKVEVTQSKALEIAKRAISQNNADYYLIEDSDNSQWVFFVDLQPGANWEHDCCVVYAPRTVSTQFELENIFPTREDRRYPPENDMVHLSAPGTGSETTEPSEPIEGDSDDTSDFEINLDIQPDLSAASRTHAIILSGGINKNSNNIRYWNDCSFIYKTLTERYAIPKNQIYPIMADGDDPSEDTRLLNNTYKSQDLDLDEDGVDEISMSASKSNIEQTLASLLAKLKQGDHLFLYVIDHGGTNGNDQSYICLWNGENLQDYELAEMLRPFSEKGVKINVVLGQCYSGGFIDDLTMEGCVVATASRGDESSWSRSTGIHDEFVYQWTCAINGLDYYGKSVKYNPDTNNDGSISMEEAFNYAKANDKKEQPLYASTPTSLGQILAFNRLEQSIELVPGVDLFIKDCPEDNGTEPNTFTQEFWKSPDIWVRNEADGVEEYQNPIYSPNHLSVAVYVRIHNRGTEDYNGGQWLHLYWTKASTAISDASWKGEELYNNEYITGDHINALHIPKIKSGQDTVIFMTWSLPPILIDEGVNEYHHYCLLAKITNTHRDEIYDVEVKHFDLEGSNKQASRNTSVVVADEYKKTSVFVRNIARTRKAYSLEFVGQDFVDRQLFSDANVEMSLSNTIYEAWEQGGLSATSVQLANPTTYTISENSASGNIEHVVYLTSVENKLENICLNAGEFDKVALNFDFLQPGQQPEYTFDLVQKDENGKIVGGETFVIKSPQVSSETIQITSDVNSGEIKLGLTGGDIKSVKWFNSNNEPVGTSETLEVRPSEGNEQFRAVAYMQDGQIAFDTIDLKDSYGIKSVSTEGNKTIVELNQEPTDNGVIKVISVIDSQIKDSVSLEKGQKTVIVDTSDLANGVYSISYVESDVAVDSKKFVK